MNILLLSMPDSFEHTAPVTMRMPNGALGSLAGNIDAHHRVAIADLILVHGRIRETIERLVRDLQPDLVGLSIMTFQRRTAQRLASLIRSLAPSATIVVGGYDPSLATDVYEAGDWEIDLIVRGEGDITIRELVRALERGSGVESIAGISYRTPDGFVRTPDRAGQHADRGGGASPESRRASARRLHVHRPSDRCGGDVARLHLRLQLLFDHRNARSQFPHVVDRARAGGHRRRTRAGCAHHLHRRRQHHPERRALRGAVQGDHRKPVSTTSTTSSRR